MLFILKKFPFYSFPFCRMNNKADSANKTSRSKYFNRKCFLFIFLKFYSDPFYSIVTRMILKIS